MTGTSIDQLFSGTIPEPSYVLNWGEDIPSNIMEALRRGETATLNDKDGNPYSRVLMDSYGTIREKCLK